MIASLPESTRSLNPGDPDILELADKIFGSAPEPDLPDAADDAAPDASAEYQEQNQDWHAVSLKRREDRAPERREQRDQNPRSVKWG